MKECGDQRVWFDEGRSSEEAEGTTIVDGVSSLGALVLIPQEPVMTGSTMNQQYQGRLRGHDLMMREIFLVWLLERSWSEIAEKSNSAYSEQASQSPNRAL